VDCVAISLKTDLIRSSRGNTVLSSFRNQRNISHGRLSCRTVVETAGGATTKAKIYPHNQTYLAINSNSRRCSPGNEEEARTNEAHRICSWWDRLSRP